MKILFVTVDWMKYYVGEGDEEKETPLCGYNFQYINGSYYGYGQALDTINIEAFEGVSPEDDKVEGVLVIWLAHNKEGKRCIIGWYKNATVYKGVQTELTLDSERICMNYSIVAEAKKCLLLPVEERRFSVEHKEDPIWIEPASIVTGQIAAYIHNYSGDQMNLVLTQEELQKTLTISMDYEKYFYKADEFLAKDCYAKAIKCFNKAIKEEPNETLGYECKGSILLSLKMYNEAKKAYEAVLERDEDNDLAYYCLGLLHGLTKSYEVSLDYFNNYMNRRPEDAQAQAERSMVHYALGNLDAARADIEAACQSDVSNEVFKQIKNYVSK